MLFILFLQRKALLTFNPTKKAELRAKLLFSERFLSDPQVLDRVVRKGGGRGRGDEEKQSLEKSNEEKRNEAKLRVWG